MRKRCITGILLAALLVSLCGCTSVFDKEYLSVRPYEEPSNLLTDADTTQIRNYAGLMRALNTMAAQYERSFVLAFGDYDGIIADDLAAACEELRTGTAIGAYCIESVSYETEQVIAYCEASITITYNRPESEVRSIYSAQTQKSILDCVVDALDRQKTQFAIQISTSTLETDDVAALVRSACLNQPQLVVDFPSIDVTVYSGSSNSQKIFGITLQYSVSESAVNDRRTQLDGRVRTLMSALTTGEQETSLQAALVVMRACEQRISTVSTAYDALVNGSADSYGLAMAYKAVCDALNIPCQVVSGRFQGKIAAGTSCRSAAITIIWICPCSRRRCGCAAMRACAAPISGTRRAARPARRSRSSGARDRSCNAGFAKKIKKGLTSRLFVVK